MRRVNLSILVWMIYYHLNTSGDTSLCCGTTDYSKSNYLYCSNGKDYSTGPISSCATCVSYQCIDWTFGSAANTAREKSFLARTGEKVYFGVGSYSSANPTPGGLCYRITASNLDRDLIVQMVNTGGDVPNGNVDMQTGDGGFGLFDACTIDTTQMPQFPGTASVWGDVYGGVSTIEECSNIPPYPICGTAPQDSMIDLCKVSFTSGLRNGNPVISQICQVACPSELYTATGLRRSDEANTLYVCNNNADPPGGSVTKTMDCTKPSFGWPDNVGGPTYAGYTAVVPCRRDGYTRVNQMASSSGAVPTAEPAASTPIPVANPATSPTLDPTLCCSGTDYSKINYYNCESGVLPLAPISTCATCVAYQCIDWTLGSAANAAREADYFAQTGDSVYFGVGSYSNRTSYAGLCLRVSSASIDRDLIVQIVDQGYGLDSGNINLQVGDGGFGGTDACTIESTTMPQFAGPGTNWGNIYGGVATRAACASLPPYPFCGTAPQDSMVDLCEFSFDHGFRLKGNPPISSICQVACPPQLVQATGIHRADEQNKNYVCSGKSLKAGQITKTMNCAKPSFAWTNNVGKPTVPGYSTVIPCRRDGYTRVNQLPTASAPTGQPVSPSTAASTTKPTVSPSRPPSRAPTKKAQSTLRPTVEPSSSQTIIPSSEPSNSLTQSPSMPPTSAPSNLPSKSPSVSPTTATPHSVSPTRIQTGFPSAIPFSTSPSMGHTSPPTVTISPSKSISTTLSPSLKLNSATPSSILTGPPTRAPTTHSPTKTSKPTFTKSFRPTMSPNYSIKPSSSKPAVAP